LLRLGLTGRGAGRLRGRRLRGRGCGRLSLPRRHLMQPVQRAELREQITFAGTLLADRDRTGRIGRLDGLGRLVVRIGGDRHETGGRLRNGVHGRGPSVKGWTTRSGTSGRGTYGRSQTEAEIRTHKASARA